MSEQIDEIIKEIAVKHGVSLSKEDPILMLQTMNERLITQNERVQQELLAQFRAEIEQIALNWKDDAKEKAEKILNHSLAASKEAIARMLNESVTENVKAIQKVVAESLNESKQFAEQARNTSRFTLIASSCILVTSGILAYFLLLAR